MKPALGLALLLPTLAGLSTVLGSLLAVLVRRAGPRSMSLMLGFSAGVMILVSFGELLQEGIEESGFALAYLAFFGGMGVMFLIDVLIPHIHMDERHDAGGEAKVRPLPEMGGVAGTATAIGVPGTEGYIESGCSRPGCWRHWTSACTISPRVSPPSWG